VGVVGEVMIVSVLVKVGNPSIGVRVADAPLGSPEAERVTC
jgi:hypothetical protein